MRQLIVFLCASAVAATASATVAAAPALPMVPQPDVAAAWPLAGEGLTADPAWQWGRLPNGLRYVVRENALPAGRVSYRLIVEVGGVHETLAERGFSHFIEHLAFNGTRRFPGDALAKQFGGRGLAFGPEVSAFTFPSHTIYQFDAPGNTAADVGWMLSVLRDFADGINFDPKEMKRELGVIQAELRDRMSPGLRGSLARSFHLYPGSPLRDALHVTPAPHTPDSVRAFYRKWYRPERMILVVVGDAAAANLATAIEREFASLEAAPTPAGVFDPGYIGPPRRGESGTAVFHDLQGGGLWMELVSVQTRPGPDSRAQRRRQFAANLAAQALHERLEIIVRERPKVFGSLGTRIDEPTPISLETSVFASLPSDAWETGVNTLRDELRRSIEYTFFNEELDDAKARLLIAAEQSVRTARTMESPGLAAWMAQCALFRTVPLSPEDNLALTRELLAAIDRLEVAQAWRTSWAESNVRLFAYGYFPVRNGQRIVDDALIAGNASRIDPPQHRPRIAFPYTDFGPPGELRQHRHHPDTDLHMLEFANGVRVNLKRTTFVADRIDFGAALGRGLLSLPRTASAPAPLANAALIDGGLQRLAPLELRRAFSTEPMALTFSVDEGEFTFAGHTAPARLERFLQLVAAFLTEPRFDPSALPNAVSTLSGQFSEQLRTAEGMIRLKAFHALTGEDDRYRFARPDEVQQVSADQLRMWLDPVLRGAPLEVALVGDFEPNTVIPVLARTLGAIPARTKEQSIMAPVSFAKAAKPVELPATIFSPRAATYLLWPADHGRSVHGSRRLEVLSALLDNRVNSRIREELGAAYSPSVDYWRTASGSEEGYITALVTTEPRQMKKVRRLVIAEADDLARRGVRPGELNAAVTPLLHRTRLQLSSNDYWLWRIAIKAQRQPEVLTFPATRTSEFEQITTAEINALAGEVLGKARVIQFTASPVEL